MKHTSRILVFLLMAVAVSATLLIAQQFDGKITGKVLDKDGVTPVQGASVVVTNWVSVGGQPRVREQATARTSRDGNYSLSGLMTGRITVTVKINGQDVMTKGETTGDELYLVSGLDTIVTFDLSKAPPSRN